MFRIYNTLVRSIEDFKPLHPPHVGLYACGPTVYDFAHIGHMRKYVGDDILVRTLQANGYNVKHVMNITDVGHLVSDADEGEDKMEKGARKFGKNVWELAKMFEEQFFKSTDALNVSRPDEVMRATDYITEQIALVKALEEKGFTYRLADGIYFDTAKFPDYFKLSRQNPQELKKGARVEFAQGKKNISDFALWKFSPKDEKRQMEWESPWGVGFPGWHIECSAMSMKALGPSFDIHTGGVDHINIHHTNEIAQSEAATGKPFVKYWMHYNFLVVNGQKMSKSLGNIYTVQDVEKKGFDAMSLRYLFLQTHYRQEMNFTWESLEAAQSAYKRLIQDISTWQDDGGSCGDYENKFMEAMNDDLNTAKALSIVWELVRSDNPTAAKAKSLMKMDSVLGLQLFAKASQKEAVIIPQNILDLVQSREDFRKSGDYKAADEVREKIKTLGFIVQDTKHGPEIAPIND